MWSTYRRYLVHIQRTVENSLRERWKLREFLIFSPVACLLCCCLMLRNSTLHFTSLHATSRVRSQVAYQSTPSLYIGLHSLLLLLLPSFVLSSQPLFEGVPKVSLLSEGRKHWCDHEPLGTIHRFFCPQA